MYICGAHRKSLKDNVLVIAYIVSIELLVHERMTLCKVFTENGDNSKKMWILGNGKKEGENQEKGARTRGSSSAWKSGRT